MTQDGGDSIEPDPAGTSPPAGVDAIPELADQMAKLREEFTDVIPHLVSALKRDRAVEELSERLSRAEALLAGRSTHPFALGIMRLLHALRGLNMPSDTKAYAQVEILDLLAAHGYSEFGSVSDPYDVHYHEPIEGRTIAGHGVVRAVHATGLYFGSDVVLRAKVDITPVPPAPADNC